MPINTLLTKVEESPQSDGSKHVVLRLYDQDGKEYMTPYFEAVGADRTAMIARRVTEQNERLAVSEFEAMIEAG